MAESAAAHQLGTEHLAAAFAGVVVAMAAIQPDTAEQAQRLHDSYLAAHGVDDTDIAAHWAQFGGKYTAYATSD